MATQRVIRLPRAEHGFVLIQVTSRGPKPLDLDILGTENEYPYSAKVVHDKIASLKARTDDFPDAAWQAAVAWILLRQKPSQEYQQLIERVYVEASIDEEKGFVLTFRQNIEGLTPRLGSINLTRNDELEVDVFEWAGILSDDAKSAEQSAAKLQLQHDAQQQTITNLNAQLEEFIQAKKRQEDEMLEKFRQLLNTKKLKIRDQQRLLAGAKVDKSAAEAVRKARQVHRGGRDSPSRPPKRKAQGEPRKNGSNVDEDAEMVDDDVNIEETESEDDFETRQSPQRTASEESETQNAVVPPSNSQKESRSKPKESTSNSNIKPVELPPRRELPFANKASASSSSKKAEIHAMDDDETDDEEL